MSPYKLDIKGQVVDCYDVQDAIGFRQAAVAHAFKKMFAMGNRSGGKSYEQDLDECIWSLTRAKEQLNGSVQQRASKDDRREGATTAAHKQDAGSTDRSIRNHDQVVDTPRGTVRSANHSAGAASARLSRPSPPTEDGLEEAFAYLRALDQYIWEQQGTQKPLNLDIL